MFEEPRNLIVVYKEKDEIPLNQLKKMVDTKDDDAEIGKIIGTEDGTVKIVAWSEKTWLDNKKAGNTGDLDDHILFLGDIKGVDKLIPTLDIKFDEYGVSYGVSGKQAAIMIDPKPLLKKETYDKFVESLKQVCNGQISLSDFKQPVGMNLKENNRWVKKAQTIPWLEIEKRYAALFTNRKGKAWWNTVTGNISPALPPTGLFQRMVLLILSIYEKMCSLMMELLLMPRLSSSTLTI